MSLFSDPTIGEDAAAGPAFQLATRFDYATAMVIGATTAQLDPLSLLDDVGNDRATARAITVDAPHTFSTLNAIGDWDFFKVHLTAGQSYDIGMYAAVGGPSGVPLLDAFVEVYDTNGDLLTSGDGGAPTLPNNVNSGFDVLLSFIAPADGDYFINARAFDQDPVNGTAGDGVGDYEFFVASGDPRTAYHPRYSTDSPLHSIDWGTQVDGTVRNPDGDNGPRDNGAAFYGAAHNDTYGVTGKNVVTYYFARQGDLFVDENPVSVGSTDTMLQARNMTAWEKTAFRQVLDLYESVADVVYIEVQSREEADFKFIVYNGTPGAGASLLGRMSPPDTENEGQAEFNGGDVRWTEAGLQQGGFYFPTLIHELGHGHGMAHPHDNGGHSSVMRGSESEDPTENVIGGGLADFDLSQQVFTIMSYNDGWQTSPYGTPSSGDLLAMNADNFGWMGTLGALDIAVIQDKYGVNEDTGRGNDIYELKDVNAAGTFYATIWDAAGNDTIRYSGSRDASIDLRAATLQYEEGGGGWVSYAYGIHGGFTIANGVTIENAASGSGNDRLTGNAAANVLTSGAGLDTLWGGLGKDTLNAGAGNDELNGGDGDDLLIGGVGADRFVIAGDNSGRDVIQDFARLVDRIAFTGVTGLTRFEDLSILSSARDGAKGALVTWGDGTDDIWLPGVNPLQLSPLDFDFA